MHKGGRLHSDILIPGIIIIVVYVSLDQNVYHAYNSTFKLFKMQRGLLAFSQQNIISYNAFRKVIIQRNSLYSKFRKGPFPLFLVNVSLYFLGHVPIIYSA